MSATAFESLAKSHWTEEEYLAGVELDPELKYEFVSGRVFAMATPSGVHAEISSNIFIPLHTHQRGKPCRVFKGDMALHIRFLNRPVFYIPDILVACDDGDLAKNFREKPLLIVEVMSKSTQGNDLREKLWAYCAIPGLRHYLVVNQQAVEVTHFYRMDDGWQEVTLVDPESVISIPELGYRLTVWEIYANTGVGTPEGPAAGGA